VAGASGSILAMAQVIFTSHLKHVAPPDPVPGTGGTVADVLADVFSRYPALRGYILDDQDRLRLHVAIFVDNVHVRHNALSHPMTPNSELHVLQALSGG
jgi:molybdopterin synthase sulfur carrier subunit